MLVLVIQERDKLCMIIKTGIDIIEVPRIQEAIEKYGELFLNKIFDKSEVEYCKNTGKMEYQHYAARFAAKEAVFPDAGASVPGLRPQFHEKRHRYPA